mgnify:FL=1
MEELYNESLFNEWIEVLFSISEDLNEPDAAKVIWKYAKNQAIGILCSKYPENEYKRRCISIKKDITESEVIDNIYIGFRFEQEVISTINDILLSMMLYSADDNTIKHIWNNYVEFPKHKYYNLIEYILKKLFSGTLIKNYNYNISPSKIDNNTDKQEHIDYNKELNKFIVDPIYGQCYPGIVWVLGALGLVSEEKFTIKDYVNLYHEAKDAVDKVMNAEYPEIEIPNIQADFIHNYPDQKNGNITITTRERQYGCILEMVFLIALFDSMKEKNDIVMSAFQDCREYIEYVIEYNIPYTSNPLWKLIADRIPPKNRPRLEDVQKEKEQLIDKVEQMEETLRQKDEEIENLKLGMIKEENQFKPWSTEKRINILHTLLNLPYHLEGEERKQFKDLCKFMTKAEDKTLERLLSQNSLQEMKENRNELFEEFPVLNRK